MTTEEILEAYGRKMFDEPLPVSQSLLAVADKPLSWFLNSWQNHVDLNDRRALLECVFPPGLYSRLDVSEMRERLRELRSQAKNADDYLKTGTYAATVVSLSGRWYVPADRVQKPNKHFRTMSVDELFFLSICGFGDLTFFAKLYGFEHFGLRGRLKMMLQYLEVDEFGPMMLTESIKSLIRNDGSEELDSSKEPTVGELLYVCSRFPEAFRPERLIFNDADARSIDAERSALLDGASTLRPLAGEAWMAYVVLAYQPSRTEVELDADGLIELARRYIGLGLSPVELAPYVVSGGNDFDAIAGAIDGGVHPDMLASVSGGPKAL